MSGFSGSPGTAWGGDDTFTCAEADVGEVVEPIWGVGEVGAGPSGCVQDGVGWGTVVST